MRVRLGPGESVVAAWGEHCSGPGWSNTPIWVVIRTAAGGLRMDAFQPEEQTPEMMILFNLSSAAMDEMLSRVRSALRER